MADSNIAVTEGSGKNVDTRTNDAGDHRQVIIPGHPTATNSIAETLGKDPESNTEGLVVRDVNTSAIVAGLEAVRVRNVIDGTLTTVDTVNFVTRVRNLVDGTISTVSAVTNITNSIAVHILSTNGTIAVQNATLGTVSISAKDGTMAVYFSPSKPVVLTEQHSTANIFTVTGSVTGSYPSGKTLVSPSANASFKVFAIQLTTTAQVANVVQLHNGGETETEFWRYALQAPTQGISGANISVTPPGYLFATGTSTTLAIQADAGSLIHYSISYRKESA